MSKLYNEEHIIKGCQQRDPLCQKVLYNEYYRKMYGVCLRYTDNEQDALDVLQDGFITVFDKIKGFKSKGSLEGWVRRIMIHQAIQHYRKRSRYFMVDIEQAGNIEVSANIFDHLSREEIVAQIQSLPVGYRTVFNLYVVEGYTHDEIAKMLKISTGTSKSQLSRAKKILKGQIEFLKKRCSA